MVQEKLTMSGRFFEASPSSSSFQLVRFPRCGGICMCPLSPHGQTHSVPSTNIAPNLLVMCNILADFLPKVDLKFQAPQLISQACLLASFSELEWHGTLYDEWRWGSFQGDKCRGC